MPCPEVSTGFVELPGENYERIQAEADAGRNLWRLSPVRTAQEVGSRNLGLRPDDVYTFVEQYYDPGSGLQNAVVRVKHRNCTYLVHLYQPERQGQRGIWVVQDVTEL
ncbi:hypothetical protein GCM10025857_09880 [Alicyclobacillus contaminans]|uniref:hypothetical protein n=1 Tax=Alicyclobacillus contaminans TaxID=392016 RepID=UPI0003FD0EEA|nr:hypothetical protein [Alicyclobacillus contaminans]GMA49631.1 hypothetical protein GCM10025857_09880 [Alicyclobacillus contaminans]